MEMEYDFSGLTEEQEWLLVFQGWRIGDKYPSHQPSKKTVKKLIERGLVIEHEVKQMTSIGPMTVLEYEVPLHVHMAYCMSCDGKEESDE
jgi:hypothetical protein